MLLLAAAGAWSWLEFSDEPRAARVETWWGLRMREMEFMMAAMGRLTPPPAQGKQTQGRTATGRTDTLMQTNERL